jgi:tetratricopeptide (TPR) repeat protein
MSHFERSLALRRKCFPAEHLEVGKSLYHLALVCHAEQRYDEADGHYRKSLDIKNKSLGNNHPDLINLLRNYAHLLRKTSRDSIASQMEQFASGIEAKLKA